MVLGSDPLSTRALFRRFLLVTRRSFKTPEKLFDSRVCASNPNRFLTRNVTDLLVISLLFGTRRSIGKLGTKYTMTFWVHIASSRYK